MAREFDLVIEIKGPFRRPRMRFPDLSFFGFVCHIHFYRLPHPAVRARCFFEPSPPALPREALAERLSEKGKASPYLCNEATMVEITIAGYSDRFGAMFEQVFRDMAEGAANGSRLKDGFVFFRHPDLNNPELGMGRKKFFHISPAVSVVEFGKLVSLFSEFAMWTGWELYLTCPQANLHAEIVRLE